MSYMIELIEWEKFQSKKSPEQSAGCEYVAV